MNNILFYLFSILEFTAVITLTLSIFLFNLKDNKSHMLFSAFMLAQASYIMRMATNLESISIVVQLIMMILILRFIFRIQLFYAALMGVVGYLLIGLLQMGITLAFSTISQLNIEEILSNDHLSIHYFLQLITSIICFLISQLLSKYRLGFSFIPDNDSERIQFKRSNLGLLGTIIAGIIIVSIFSYFSLSNTFNFIVITISLLIVTCVFVWLVLHKEQHND